MKIANAFMGASCFRLKFLNYRGGPGGATHGSAGNHAYPIASYIADDRVLLGAEPVLDSRIENLVCDWVPAIRKYQLARKREVWGRVQDHLILMMSFARH